MTQQPHPLLPPQHYPQDVVVVQDAVVATSLAPLRWSGRRTAAIGALVVALTTIGGLTAAAASPNGIAAPTQSGTDFGPGAGRGGFGGPQFGGQQFGGQQFGGPGGVPGARPGLPPGTRQGRQQTP